MTSLAGFTLLSQLAIHFCSRTRLWLLKGRYQKSRYKISFLPRNCVSEKVKRFERNGLKIDLPHVPVKVWLFFFFFNLNLVTLYRGMLFSIYVKDALGIEVQWGKRWGDISPGGGHSNLLQYSCLDNPMDRGAWWAIVSGLQRVGHGWSDLAQHRFLSALWACIHKVITSLLTSLCGVRESWSC